MVVPSPGSATDGRKAHCAGKGIGDFFPDMLILRSKWRYKEVGGMLSNSEKIHIWKSFSPPKNHSILLNVVTQQLITFRINLSTWHIHTYKHTHLSLFNQNVLKGYDLLRLLFPGKIEGLISILLKAYSLDEVGLECGIRQGNCQFKKSVTNASMSLRMNWKGPPRSRKDKGFPIMPTFKSL